MKPSSIVNQVKATIVAALLHFTNPSFSWEYASIISIAVRCYSTSRTIQDLLSCIAPSACCGKTVESRLVKAAKFIKDRKKTKIMVAKQLGSMIMPLPEKNISGNQRKR